MLLLWALYYIISVVVLRTLPAAFWKLARGKLHYADMASLSQGWRLSEERRCRHVTCTISVICRSFFGGCMLKVLIVTIHVQCQLCVCRFSNTSSNSFVCLGFSNPENWYSVFMYVMDSIISVLCTIFSNFSGFGEFVFPVTHHVHAWIR